MQGVSMAVVGVLFGASRQAVWKSGDVLAWVRARARRFLVPCGERPETVGRAGEVARARVAEFVSAARGRLRELGGYGGRGRRASRDPSALAKLLGILERPGEDLAAVMGRYLSRCAGQLREVGVAGVAGVRRYLDERWLPRWVRRRVGVRPCAVVALPAGRVKRREVAEVLDRQGRLLLGLPVDEEEDTESEFEPAYDDWNY